MNIKEWFNSLPKDNRRNIIMMVVIIIMFIIGIIVRWGYISEQIGVTVDGYKELIQGEGD